MKKIMAIMLLLCLFVTLVACTGGEKPEETGNQNQNNQTEEKTTEAPGFVESEEWIGPEIEVD